MKKLVAIILVTLLCGSCSQTVSPPSSFSKHGISFSVPSGWSVTEEGTAGDGVAYTCSIEKDGFDSSGLVTISWFIGNLDPQEGVTLQQNGMRENAFLKDSKLVFEPVQSSELAGYSAATSLYKMNLGGIPHSGQVGCFNTGDRYFLIAQQEADEDHAKNNAGFATLMESLKISNE